MPPELGGTPGSYQITAQIGQGGMGEVYQARDTPLDRTVAVKTLPDHEDRAARWEGKGANMHLNAAAVVGAVMVALVLLDVMIFSLAIS